MGEISRTLRRKKVRENQPFPCDPSEVVHSEAFVKKRAAKPSNRFLVVWYVDTTNGGDSE